MSQAAASQQASTELSHYELRTDLAAALRWAARQNFNEGVDNHFSLAVPDDNGQISLSLIHISEPTRPY